MPPLTPSHLHSPSTLGAPCDTPHSCPPLLQVPRVSADWEHINAFMPPAKYSVGPSVADSLRMKASSSCPELQAIAKGSGPAGSGAGNGGGDCGAGSGSAALFGPSSSDAVLSFGGSRQAPGSAAQGTDASLGSGSGPGRRATDPPEGAAAAALRKVPSAGTMRELRRSRTVAVGEVVSNTQKAGAGRSSQGGVEGGGSGGSGCAAGERPGGRSGRGRLSPSEAQAIAAAVAEAWERKASVAGRHSVTVAQVRVRSCNGALKAGCCILMKLGWRFVLLLGPGVQGRAGQCGMRVGSVAGPLPGCFAP